MSRRSGRARTADDVGLWWCVEGDSHPVVLLPGRGDSSDSFPAEFTDALVDAGSSVIRLDPRDTGLSDDGGDAYRLSDLADDVITVCDAADVERVDLVAVSMGGMIAVDLAVRYPTRVRAILFLAAMSPDPTAGIGDAFFEGIDADPVVGTLASMGSPTLDDEAWVGRRLAAARRRAADRPDAGARHQHAAFRLGWRELDDLRRINAPALVIHGTADRVLPVAHADALAAGIANSELHVIEGMGHLPTRAEWILIAAAASAFFHDG